MGVGDFLIIIGFVIFVISIYVQWHIRHAKNIFEDQEEMLKQEEEDLLKQNSQTRTTTTGVGE